jgi:hypothetical protein
MRPLRQGRPGEDSSATLEQALGREVLASERRRLTILAGVAGTVLMSSALGLLLFPATLRSWLPPAFEPTLLVGLWGRS